MDQKISESKFSNADVFMFDFEGEQSSSPDAVKSNLSKEIAGTTDDKSNDVPLLLQSIKKKNLLQAAMKRNPLPLLMKKKNHLLRFALLLVLMTKNLRLMSSNKIQKPHKIVLIMLKKKQQLKNLRRH